MATGLISLWQIDGKTKETVTDFIFLGSKITAEGDYSHEIKSFSVSKKSYGIPKQHIKKQTHYLLTNLCTVKTTVFAVVMYGCESWTIRNAECQRIDAFELWCYRRLLRVSWTAR